MGPGCNARLKLRRILVIVALPVCCRRRVRIRPPRARFSRAKTRSERAMRSSSWRGTELTRPLEAVDLYLEGYRAAHRDDPRKHREPAFAIVEHRGAQALEPGRARPGCADSDSACPPTAITLPDKTPRQHGRRSRHAARARPGQSLARRSSSCRRSFTFGAHTIAIAARAARHRGSGRHARQPVRRRHAGPVVDPARRHSGHPVGAAESSWLT